MVVLVCGEKIDSEDGKELGLREENFFFILLGFSEKRNFFFK